MGLVLESNRKSGTRILCNKTKRNNGKWQLIVNVIWSGEWPKILKVTFQGRYTKSADFLFTSKSDMSRNSVDIMKLNMIYSNLIIGSWSANFTWYTLDIYNSCISFKLRFSFLKNGLHIVVGFRSIYICWTGSGPYLHSLNFSIRCQEPRNIFPSSQFLI